MRINKETKLNTELTLLKMQYENVKETEENLAALYESAYSLKHDLEKHFIAIRTTAEQNNDKSIIEYVDSIINISLPKIKGEAIVNSLNEHIHITQFLQIIKFSMQ